ncbi:hypothetical protein HMPREF3098_04895 [Corynebacterium sp. HMSC28B08]|nr:hypothetical protein HMPREF3098_04895 [Corynebacterium sp. HMSC28B08]
MNEVDTPTPNTPVSIRRATPADAPQIGALLRAAKNEDLSAEKRAEKGFVQGNMSDDNLHTWLESPQRGGMVAVQANEIVGVCMFSPRRPRAGGSSLGWAVYNHPAVRPRCRTDDGLRPFGRHPLRSR